jgi:hypothetical protein
MSRKTVKVESILNDINTMIRNSVGSDEKSIASRNGLITALEQILCAADRYKGFRYLTQGEVRANELPGIIYDDNGVTSFPDKSRVSYY